MKNWHYFLGCLALSAGIWLIHNLSNMQTDVVTVSVIAESSLPGRSARSSEAVSMTARCKASGFRLLYIEHRDDPVVVRFDADDLVKGDGDYFTISQAQLYRYVNDILGPGTSVESFLFEELRFRFTRELYRKMPVNAISSITFKQQYMQIGDFVLQPDSVLVYGPADMLASMDAVNTRPIVRDDVKGNLHGEIALDIPPGMRFSDQSVAWSLEVCRFVQLEAEFPVSVRNVPPESSISIYPASVKVSFNCLFPVVADPLSVASCYVDYKDFTNSLTGRCLIQCDNIPQGVISYSIKPEVAECVERL